MKKLLLICCLGISFLQVFAQNPPALSAIKKQDLKNDLYAMADAHFRGRSAGTIDELKASMWVAEKFRSIGLQPAGDDGTYLQFFTMWRNRIADQSPIAINNKPLVLWKDVAVAQMANKQLDAPIMYLGNAASIDTNKLDVKGKVVAIEANAVGINLNVSLPTWRYSRSVYVKYGLPLIRRGAAAIIFIADNVAENAWDDAVENFKRGTYDIDGGPAVNVTTTVPVLWLHASAKSDLQANGATIKANLIIEHVEYPS
ncbi:MAG: peptidase M28, partial [Deinococcales bacterium]|nr:peptidase M28 [Chitinophagaceae bacterium]